MDSRMHRAGKTSSTRSGRLLLPLRNRQPNSMRSDQGLDGYFSTCSSSKAKDRRSLTKGIELALCMFVYYATGLLTRLQLHDDDFRRQRLWQTSRGQIVGLANLMVARDFRQYYLEPGFPG